MAGKVRLCFLKTVGSELEQLGARRNVRTALDSLGVRQIGLEMEIGGEKILINLETRRQRLSTLTLHVESEPWPVTPSRHAQFDLFQEHIGPAPMCSGHKSNNKV